MKTNRRIRAAALATVLALLFLFSSCGFSFEKSNLKRYVKLAREDYYGITVSVPEAKSVAESDVDLEIETFRLKLRTLVSKGETTRHAQWGDTVNLYYYMTVEYENGWYLPPDGFSNMTEGETGPFIIGGGVLPKAFETALTDHAATETVFSPITDENETVAATDVAYLDLTYRLSDGETTTSGSHVGVRIDLSAPGPAGDTLVSALVGRHPGEEFDFGINEGEPLVADWDGDGENETLSVAGVIGCVSRNERLARVEADVPADFFDVEIAGRHVVMYYAIDSVDACSVPEITKELLAEYVPAFTPTEGGDLNGEFRDYVYNLLLGESRREWHAAIEEQLWAHFDTLDCVKKLPRSALRKEIKEQERQLEQLYLFYGARYEEKYGVNPFATVEEFGDAYYELDGSEYSDVHEYLKKVVAPFVVRQKLILYYIADREGWKATEEEYEAQLPDQIAYYANQLAYYADVEEVTAEEALAIYGETFFREAIQYNKVLTNLVEVTKIR